MVGLQGRQRQTQGDRYPAIENKMKSNWIMAHRKTYKKALRIVVCDAVDKERNARVVIIVGEGHLSVVQESICINSDDSGALLSSRSGKAYNYQACRS